MLAKQKDPVMVQSRIIKEKFLTFPPNSFCQILSLQNSIGSRRTTPERKSFRFDFCNVIAHPFFCTFINLKNNGMQHTTLLRKDGSPAITAESSAVRDCRIWKIHPPAAVSFLAAESGFVLCQHPALLCVRLPGNICHYQHCETQRSHC